MREKNKERERERWFVRVSAYAKEMERKMGKKDGRTLGTGGKEREIRESEGEKESEEEGRSN